MTLMVALGERHMKARHRGGCDTTERDFPASHTRDPQALSKPSSAEPGGQCPWEERETTKELCGLPTGAKHDQTLSKPVLLTAWGMTATKLGGKWDDSKIHPKGISLFVY